MGSSLSCCDGERSRSQKIVIPEGEGVHLANEAKAPVEKAEEDDKINIPEVTEVEYENISDDEDETQKVHDEDVASPVLSAGEPVENMILEGEQFFGSTGDLSSRKMDKMNLDSDMVDVDLDGNDNDGFDDDEDVDLDAVHAQLRAAEDLIRDTEAANAAKEAEEIDKLMAEENNVDSSLLDRLDADADVEEGEFPAPSSPGRIIHADNIGGVRRMSSELRIASVEHPEVPPRNNDDVDPNAGKEGEENGDGDAGEEDGDKNANGQDEEPEEIVDHPIDASPEDLERLNSAGTNAYEEEEEEEEEEPVAEKPQETPAVVVSKSGIRLVSVSPSVDTNAKSAEEEEEEEEEEEKEEENEEDEAGRNKANGMTFENRGRDGKGLKYKYRRADEEEEDVVEVQVLTAEAEVEVIRDEEEYRQQIESNPYASSFFRTKEEREREEQEYLQQIAPEPEPEPVAVAAEAEAEAGEEENKGEGEGEEATDEAKKKKAEEEDDDEYGDESAVGPVIREDESIDDRALLRWVDGILLEEYKSYGLRARNWTTNWRSGLVICALVQYYHGSEPELEGLDDKDARKNWDLALEVAWDNFRHEKLNVNEVITGRPNRKKIVNYVIGLYKIFEG